MSLNEILLSVATILIITLVLRILIGVYHGVKPPIPHVLKVVTVAWAVETIVVILLTKVTGTPLSYSSWIINVTLTAMIYKWLLRVPGKGKFTSQNAFVLALICKSLVGILTWLCILLCVSLVLI